MEHYEKNWKSFDGIDLYSQTWKTSGKVRAVINLIHGLGEHSSRYTHWAEKFTNIGFIVRSFDLRGHGLSGGKRGYSPDYQVLLTDIDDFIKMGKEEYRSLPFFLYGHSLGGSLVLNYASGKIPDVNGLIITSPWLELVTKPSPGIFFILSILSNFFPALQVSSGLNIDGISRDEQVILDYKTDPLVHDRIALRLGFQLFQAGTKAASCIHKINMPMLIMHGNADRITSCKATQNFVRNSGNRTTYIEWEGGYHELHNDLDREKVFKAISDWLNSIV